EDLIDAEVDDRVQGVSLFFLLQVLADAVKNNHGVVERIAGQGEQGGDDQQVELEAEQPADAEHGQHVMEGGGGRGDAETQVKTQGQVGQDAEQGNSDGEDGLVPE